MKRCVLFSVTARMLIALGVGIVLCTPTALPAGKPDILWESTVLWLRQPPEATSARGRLSFVNNAFPPGHHRADPQHLRLHGGQDPEWAGGRPRKSTIKMGGKLTR